MTPGLSLRKATDSIIVTTLLGSPLADLKSLDRKARLDGYVMIGHHFVITNDGQVQHGRPLCAIAIGDPRAVSICRVGLSGAAVGALRGLLEELLLDYPGAAVVHRRIDA